MAVQGDLWERPPPRRFVNLDTIEYAVRSKDGGVTVMGKRRQREVHINLSDAQVAELIARLRRPA